MIEISTLDDLLRLSDYTDTEYPLNGDYILMEDIDMSSIEDATSNIWWPADGAGTEFIYVNQSNEVTNYGTTGLSGAYFYVLYGEADSIDNYDYLTEEEYTEEGGEFNLTSDARIFDEDIGASVSQLNPSERGTIWGFPPVTLLGGSFNFNGHVVSGMFIENNGNTGLKGNHGFFDTVLDGEIIDANITGASIEVRDVSGADGNGIIAGKAMRTDVIGGYVSGTLSANTDSSFANSGGAVGMLGDDRNRSYMENVVHEGSVEGGELCGGLVGSGSFDCFGCAHSGDVGPAVQSVAGFAGEYQGGEMENCYFKSNLTGDIDQSGLFGSLSFNAPDTTVKNVYFITTFNPTVNTVAAGIAQSDSNGANLTLEDVWYTAPMPSDGFIAMENCFNTSGIDVYAMTENSQTSNLFGFNDSSFSPTEITQAELEGADGNGAMSGLDFTNSWKPAGGDYPTLVQTPEETELSGTVTDYNGNPIEGDVVASGDGSTFTTNSSGEYTYGSVSGLTKFLSIQGTASSIYHPSKQGPTLDWTYAAVEVRVVNSQTEEPVEGAIVEFEGKQAATDSNGSVRITTALLQEYNFTVLSSFDVSIKAYVQGELYTREVTEEDGSILIDLSITDGESGRVVSNITAETGATVKPIRSGEAGTLTIPYPIGDNTEGLVVGRGDKRYKDTIVDVGINDAQDGIDLEVERRTPTVNF